MSDQNVNVKKVKAYPFAAQFKTASRTLPAKIVKLTLQGFLAEVSSGLLQPGDHFEVSFELPALHTLVTAPGTVVKIYNQWAGNSTKLGSGAAPSPSVNPDPGKAGPAAAASPSVLRLVEVHFQSLPLTDKEKIVEFLQALAKAPKSS